MKEKVSKKFGELYGSGAILFASPGRINLIGEHTDYNGGFVFPGAVDKGIVAAIKLNGTVPAGKVFVDGYGVGDVGSVVLRDRKHLAEDGMIVVVVSMSGEDGALVPGPDIITRGFVYVKESEGLMDELRQVALDAILDVDTRYATDWSAIKQSIKADLSNYLYKKTKRSPMILPVIMEV